MEAVPKLPLINFELKSSPENSLFGPKLKQYIAEAYREDPESYSNEIHQMESLRSVAVRPTMDAEGLNGLNKYFCQLRSLQSRFPMAKGQPAAVSFSWRDLYAHMACSLADIRFEMACILYNIGALHSYLGASEPRNSADSLKAACTHYQNAAWAFQYLKEQYPQPPGVDVSTEIMRLLQKICFAQAQECILEKSIQDTRKPSVVGAVATQVLIFYKSALAVLGPSAGSDNIHEIIGTKLYNYWHRYLSFKAAYIGCIVCLYQGMNAEEQQKMGERVAFYQLSVDRLADTRKLAKYIEPVQVTQEALTFTNDVVEGKRKAAKNENEFIYHEEVPEKDLLVEMKPVCLVKALAINFNDPEVSGPDVFARLVPICAHEASSLYSEEKAKILRQIVTQAESKNTELTEFMSSLQLDQLEVIDSDQKIPQDIVDRCAAMNAKSEIIQTLVDSMNNLAEIISDVEHSLAEVKNLIQEETMKEKEYQKSMGPRPPSIVQTELSREYHKYHEAHTRTNESNQVLHKAMTLHIANLKLLAQPLDELQTKIPSIDNIEGLDRNTMSEMRRVVAKAREMQTQRDSLIQSLREDITNDDITSQLLARSSENTEDIFKEELEKHGHKVKIIEQNLVAQENIINKLTSLYASYGESRRMLTDVLRKREGVINALITSYDAYEELLAKSQKGLDFYKKLFHNVNQLLTRLKGTCQVQEEERSQLLAKNSKPSTPTPSIAPSSIDISAAPLPPGGAPRKLKDYLPYMKTKTRAGTPQGMESMSSDAYYAEQMYPPSVRPTPVGSEDTQMQLPDGIMSQNQNPQDRYYAPETDPYASQHNYPYAAPSKVDKPEENYGYSSPYTPQQYSMVDPSHSYSNSYYSATHNSNTNVTDSQSSYPSAATPNQYSNPSQNQANGNPNQYANQPTSQGTVNSNPYSYDPYSQSGQSNVATPIPDVVPAYNTAGLNSSFSQMHVSASKSEPAANFGQDYTQTFFNVQYPQVTNRNYATYTPSMNTSANPNMIQTPSEFSSLNYPYSDATVQGMNSNSSMGNNVGNPAPNMGNSYSDQSQYGQMTNAPGQANHNFHTQAANHNVANPNTVNPNMANNNAQGQMSNPNMQGQMTNPNIQVQMSNPNMDNPNTANTNVQGQVINPNMQGQMTNPNMQMSNLNVANPNVQGQMANVNMQGQMTNPNMQEQITNPNMQGQMTNPNIQGQMTNPNLQGQMSNSSMVNPNIQAQTATSNMAGQMANPNIQGQMTNPNIQAQTAPSIVNSSMANPVVNPYDATQYNQTNIPNSSIPNVANPYSTEQYISSSYSNVSVGYPTYTNAESTVTSTTNTNPQANFPPADHAYTNTSMAHLDAIDKPIKSHVTGEALSSHLTYQNYGVQSVPSSQMQPTEQNYQPSNAYGYSDQPNVNYSQGYQNHPGYTFNNASGGYDYSYGSQNAYAATTYDANQGNTNLQETDKNPNLPAQSVYTSAGAHATLQSPSGTPQLDQNASNNQIYYNAPYGYITNTNQAQDMMPNPQAMSTNYGANMNQSTYMQSGQGNTNTTSTNQVSSPTENIQAPNFEQNSYPIADQSQVTNQSGNNQLSNDVQNVQNSVNSHSSTGYNQAQGFSQEQQTDQSVNPNQTTHPKPANQVSVPPNQNLQISQKAPEIQRHSKPVPEQKPTVKPDIEETISEPSVFDLLSEIDFTVKTKILMPEIKVPQVSETSIKKPHPKPEPVKKRVKERVFKRPPKRKIFSNPSLMNLFTQEAKNLQARAESLIITDGTTLDSEWKAFQDLQNKENMIRSKTIAMQHTSGNIVTEVVPYDDSRLTLQCDPDAYLNATLYKHLSSWCIPLVISATPSEQQHLTFWRAVIENQVTCVVCLESEIEMQGKVYWPTAKGTTLTLPGVTVLLEDVNCNVHWTERQLKVTGTGTGHTALGVLGVTHIQINVFPTKIVCSPLLLLVDRMMNLSFETAWIQCSAGGGRSAVLALLCMLVCQVRAGQVNLCDILDKGCVHLYKKRCNVMEDKKYLVDAHRATLFYVQGVLLSGTTSFNGESVSSTSGASILLPVPPSPNTPPKQKFSRESFEEMKQSPGLKSGDMKDPLNFLDPLWSLKKK